MSDKVTVSAGVKQFVKLFWEGVDAWTRAGVLYVEMLEKSPGVADEIIAQCPDISRAVLGRFEEVGRKSLHPKLLVMDGPGPSRLRMMPYSVQLRHIESPLEMLTCRNGNSDTLLVHVRELSSEAAKQVFAVDHVRSLAEQRNYIESTAALTKERKKTAKEDVREIPWVIEGRGKRVRIDAPCVMSRQEVGAILAAMN